jgi:hypothetical protein
MRTTIFLLLLLPVAANAANVRFEAGGGFATELDPSQTFLVAQGGGTVDFRYVEPGISVSFFNGGKAGQIMDERYAGSLQAWSAVALLRFHTAGEHQFVFGLGAGVGQLQRFDLKGTLATYRGAVAPATRVEAGYRYSGETLSLGLGLGLHIFNRVTESGGPAGSFGAWALVLTIGARSPAL